MGSVAPGQLARPGIMVVHPKLHDATAENEAVFLRWTKLHDRDILGLSSAETGESKVTRTLRFSNALGTKTSEAVQSRLFYTLHTDDVALYKTPEYYAISRRLRLEDTRALLPGEEAVACPEETMVWDVVDARFAIYELVGNGQGEPLDEQTLEKKNTEVSSSFQDMPTRLTSRLGSNPLSSLIGFGLPSSAPLQHVQTIQAEFVSYFTSRAPDVLQVYTSLYRNAGPDAQPDMHSRIEEEAVGGGGWLVLVLIVDEDGETLNVEHVRGVLGKWTESVERQGLKYGVWSGEMFMS